MIFRGVPFPLCFILPVGTLDILFGGGGGGGGGGCGDRVLCFCFCLLCFDFRSMQYF